MSQQNGREEKIAVIRNFVLARRRKSGIIPGRDRVPEPSCIAVGEFLNLVEVQLVRTEEGHGGWNELKHDDVLDGAFRYVTGGVRG